MKLKITIIGRVQDVGYRLFLLNHADSLLIKRFSARNVKIDGEQALIVLVEGIEKKVKEFLNIVKSQKPEKAVVEKIKVEEYKGEIGSIDSYRSSLMIEQLSKIVNIGLEMVGKQDKMLEKQDSMLGKQDEMLGKMDLMLEKQDETIKVIREESERTREHFGRKIDESKEYLAKKIDESKELSAGK